MSDDDFKPFTQVSRNRVKKKLKELIKHGKAAGLLWYFAVMVEDGIAPGDYETIMKVTGMSTATIASHLPRLQSFGFITPADPDPQTAASRYRVNDELMRFAMQPTLEVKEVKPKTGTLETKDAGRTTLEVEVEKAVVVKESLEGVETDLKPQLQDSKASASKVEVEAISETKEPRPLPEDVADFTDSRNPFEIYEDEGYGKLTPGVGNLLGDAIDTYGEEWVKAALMLGVWRNIKTLAYMDGTLRGMAGEMPRREVKAQAEARKAWNIEDEPVQSPASKPAPAVSSTPAVLVNGKNPHTQWEMAYGQLQLQMPREAFDTWLRGAKLMTFKPEGNVFCLQVANECAQAWLEHRLKKVIVRTLSQVVGAPTEVVFTLAGAEVPSAESKAA